MNRPAKLSPVLSTAAERYEALRELGDAYMLAMQNAEGWHEVWQKALARVEAIEALPQRIDA